MTEAIYAADARDRDPELAPEIEADYLPPVPAGRCSCDDEFRELCLHCQAVADWARWVNEAEARRRGSWIAG